MTDLVSQLVGALERLLNSDPDGAIATASEDDLTLAANDLKADPVIREQAASVLQARAALTAAKAGGWVSPYDSVPQPDQTVLVWSRHTWETAPCLKIDTWAMQCEAPLSFSTATIETGYGWDDHEDFESVIAWQPLPAPPAQRGEG